MLLDEYQESAKQAAFFEKDDLSYNALGLNEEAGEVAGKIKKMLRDDNGILTESKVNEIKAELGDTLYYLARVASRLNISLASVAQGNLDKIADRISRGTQHGSGDNR